MNAGDDDGDQPGGHASMRRAGLMLTNPYLLLAFASLCWSGNHIIGRAIAGHVPPIGISTVRWLIPALVLWPIARPHLRRDWLLIKPHWRLMLWLGLTGGCAVQCAAICRIAVYNGIERVGVEFAVAGLHCPRRNIGVSRPHRDFPSIRNCHLADRRARHRRPRQLRDADPACIQLGRSHNCIQYGGFWHLFRLPTTTATDPLAELHVHARHDLRDRYTAVFPLGGDVGICFSANRTDGIRRHLCIDFPQSSRLCCMEPWRGAYWG